MGKIENAGKFNPMGNMRKKIASQKMLLEAQDETIARCLDEIIRLKKANTEAPGKKSGAQVLQLVKKLAEKE